MRRDSGIARPEDLKGREVGVPSYAMTAALWVRGILSDDHDVRPGDVRWRTGGLEKPGRDDGNALDMPGIEAEAIPAGRSLNDMLVRGEIAALVTAREPSCFLSGDPNVRRLFKDPHAVERGWYRKRRMFPIMHLVAVRESLARAEPWLPSSLFEAFRAAKDLCLTELRSTAASQVSLPWLAAAVSEAESLMGPDFWKYGFEENKAELEAVTCWSHEQGLSLKRLDPGELFHPATLAL